MSIIDTLITDRTPADAALVRSLNATGWAAMTDEQRALYLSEQLKGAYKASDLNRVNSAMDYLVGRLKSRGINVELLAATEWRDSDVPSSAQLEAYLSNVSTLRSVLPGAYPEIPADMDDGLTVDEANNIEVVLVTIEQFITNMLATYRHCGVTVSGMGGLFF